MTSCAVPEPKNPARELYELMKAWAVVPGSVSVLQQRGDPDWWTNHVQAVELVRQVEAQIEEIRSADPEGEAPIGEGALRRVKQVVLAVDVRMTEAISTERELISRDDLSTLHLLAALWRAKAPVNPGAAVDVLTTARELEDLVVNLLGLDPQSRDYLLSLIHNLQAAVIAVNVRGTVDVEHLTDQLAGALARLFPDEGLPEERAKAESLFTTLVGRVKLFLGLVPPTAKAIDSVQSLFTGQAALPPGE